MSQQRWTIGHDFWLLVAVFIGCVVLPLLFG